MKSQNLQHGVTLVELMIGMTVGLFVVAGVLTVYVSTLNSTKDTLQQSRLNQEIMTLVNIMSTDIRRAGYWADATPSNSSSNPFSEEGGTALDVRDASANTSAGDTGSGNCITYAYDSDNSGGNPSVTELLGFKLVDNAIWMRSSCDDSGTSNDCSYAGTNADDCARGSWERITDQNTINVNALTFDLSNAQCINATQDDDTSTGGVDENNCYASQGGVAPSAGDITGEIRNVEISLNAELISDDLVDASMNITVRVRNDQIRVR